MRKCAVEVVTTGIVMVGRCEVQTKGCSARKKPAPITAVWIPPGRTQCNVCRACLEEKMRNGEWEVPGARVMPKPKKVRKAKTSV